MIRFLAALLAALCGSAALAQYPNKPIRLIVPFPPGGAAELGARISRSRSASSSASR